MNNIIEMIEDIPRVSHRVIAENTNNKFVSIQNLININLSDFKEFGTLHVDESSIKTAGGMQTQKTYYLNEPQATLLMTYLRNSEIVKRFKIALVKEFYTLKKKKDRETLKPMLDYEGGKVAHVLHGFKHEINPTAFLNVALIKKMEDMFGINNVRDFYSKLTGIKVDPILLLGDEIVAFCDEWIFKDKHSFTCNDDIYDGYCLWLRTKGDKKPIEKMNFSRRFSKLNRDIKVQKRFGSERKMGYKLLLKGDIR